jgi:hypothetical protein
MHAPSTLLFGVRFIRLDIWHDEPNGQDAGTVCGNPPMTLLGGILWGIRHARHLHYRFWPYLKVRRWIRDHCDECGRRFLWKGARHGYMGSDAVYHDQCMSLRATRSNLDDLTAHVLGAADWDTGWRAKYRLDHITAMRSDPSADQLLGN